MPLAGTIPPDLRTLIERGYREVGAWRLLRSRIVWLLGLLFANLLGAALPFLFARLGLDPAMASGPLITTAADAAGLLIYFSYAVLVL